jgi:hypothetical protein
MAGDDTGPVDGSETDQRFLARRHEPALGMD